ncbi:Os02g0692800 [Oryza sativa Japonica Group]|uniref:Os02g0692800 protein n=1 Tax=Oryza sativa subsp. japonica TaxID=39947 RepID=A0A0P0VNF4_ORYSJ|nr:Os02g0692800 [Oryza sativa Japonica Group]
MSPTPLLRAHASSDRASPSSDQGSPLNAIVVRSRGGRLLRSTPDLRLVVRLRSTPDLLLAVIVLRHQTTSAHASQPPPSMMRCYPLCLKRHRHPTSPPFSAAGPLSPRSAPPMRRCLLYPPSPPRPSNSSAATTDTIHPLTITGCRFH